MGLLEAVEQANDIVNEAVWDLPRVRSREVGLDNRAGSVFVDVDNELIITKAHNAHSLEYFGGFEYIDDGNTATIGDFKIYGLKESDSRIQRCIEIYQSKHEDEEE